LTNADFEQGTEGWDLQPASQNSMHAETLKDFGRIEGRYKVSNGDHFLVTQRSNQRPNSFSQTIKNLTPGRLYTLRMITADRSDLQSGKSERQTHALSITLPGASVVPDRELHLPYLCEASGKIKPFNAKKPCWLNYHWVLFKAESDTAKLVVSDWSDPKHPGGPVDQELVFNFLQIEPYYAPEPGAE
jgi:hypothetical protein